ncbi:hypothetical protein ABZ616_39330 [Streptomyces noursei]|uniref:hypothetical protein n=1 Tax=Streptomyces noursei TaxID=1971 RepID=UPI00340CEC5D
MNKGTFVLQLGPYGGNFARVDENRKDAMVIVMSEGDEKGRRWVLEPTDHGTCTLRNQKTGTYLTFEGEPHVNKPGCTGDAREWELRAFSGPLMGNFHLVVPGGQVEGEELVFDASALRIFPPQTALRPIRPSDMAQTWMLKRVTED